MPICSELFWPGLRTQFDNPNINRMKQRLQFFRDLMCLALPQGNTRAARPEPCAAGFVCPAGTSNRTGAADGAAAEEAPVAEEGAELPGACSDFSWIKETCLTQGASKDVLECFMFYYVPFRTQFCWGPVSILGWEA